jgi:hypothetical protein
MRRLKCASTDLDDGLEHGNHAHAHDVGLAGARRLGLELVVHLKASLSRPSEGDRTYQLHVLDQRGLSRGMRPCESWTPNPIQCDVQSASPRPLTKQQQPMLRMVADHAHPGRGGAASHRTRTAVKPMTRLSIQHHGTTCNADVDALCSTKRPNPQKSNDCTQACGPFYALSASVFTVTGSADLQWLFQTASCLPHSNGLCQNLYNVLTAFPGLRPHDG